MEGGRILVWVITGSMEQPRPAGPPRKLELEAHAAFGRRPENIGTRTGLGEFLRNQEMKEGTSSMTRNDRRLPQPRAGEPGGRQGRGQGRGRSQNKPARSARHRARPQESYLKWKRSVEFWIGGEGDHWLRGNDGSAEGSCRAIGEAFFKSRIEWLRWQGEGPQGP